MKKFEYKIVQVSKTSPNDGIEAGLNKLGAEGWELLDVDHSVMFLTGIFKREIKG